MLSNNQLCRRIKRILQRYPHPSNTFLRFESNANTESKREWRWRPLPILKPKTKTLPFLQRLPMLSRPLTLTLPMLSPLLPLSASLGSPAIPWPALSSVPFSATVSSLLFFCFVFHGFDFRLFCCDSSIQFVY